MMIPDDSAGREGNVPTADAFMYLGFSALAAESYENSSAASYNRLWRVHATLGPLTFYELDGAPKRDALKPRRFSFYFPTSYLAHLHFHRQHS
jgi:hypothetical protein